MNIFEKIGIWTNKKVNWENRGKYRCNICWKYDFLGNLYYSDVKEANYHEKCIKELSSEITIVETNGDAICSICDTHCLKIGVNGKLPYPETFCCYCRNKKDDFCSNCLEEHAVFIERDLMKL